MSQVLCSMISKTLHASNWLNHKTLHIPLKGQLRWRRIRKRKPTWLPTAPSKVFKIPVHPYVDPEEKQVMAELVEEYYTKTHSLKKFFQKEIAKKDDESFIAMAKAQAEESEHQMLMEYNRQENERVKLIREETMEKELQEKIVNLLVAYEEKQKEKEKRKEEIEEIVRKAKEIYSNCIGYDTLDEVIEHALDHPYNINFTIDLHGTITWEGIPPKDYEEKIKKQLGIPL